MTVDVEQALRDHAVDASDAVPSPDGWDRLVARLVDGEAGVVALDGPRWRPPRLLAAAAAVLVLLGIGAIAVAVADRPDGDQVRSGPPDEGRAPDDGESADPRDTSPGTPRPDEVAAIVDTDGNGLGALVLLGSDGEVRATLVPEPVASPPGATGSNTDTGPVTVDRLPDGTVLYGTCCEPAPGEVFAVSPGGGTPRPVGYGEHPTASPDGSRVAVSIQGTGIRLIDLATGEREPVLSDGQPLAMGYDDLVLGLAWAPDGSALLVDWLIRDEKMDDWYHAVEHVDLETGQRLSVWDDSDESLDGGSAHGTFLADGRVAFVTGVPTATDLDSAALFPVGTGISVFDPRTGDAEPRYGRLRVGSLDSTADGQWVLATSEGGAVRVFRGTDLRDEGTMLVDERLLAAAW